MIIDAHVHIGRFVAPWRSHDPVADTVATARECGIDKLCVCSLGDGGYTPYPSPEQLRAANNQVLEAISRFPNVILGYCYVSPQHPQESLAEIHRCVEDGPMVGIKLWVARKASDKLVDVILQEAARLNVPVLQHAWYKTTGNLLDESTPADVAQMARRHPDVLIQMAHLHGGGERGVQDIAPYQNVVVDTSGGDPEAGLVEYAVRELGAERVVFGSDVPGRDFSVQLGKIMGADLTEAQRDLILGGNMARILRLEG
jgi:predicted TIM-barrel fold metal-dependent hydrolase